MKFVRLFFPGDDYEDAYVYMGWLNAVTSDRKLKMIHLEKIAAHIDARHSASCPVATYCFARNDWLSSGSAKALLKSPAIKDAFIAAMDAFPSNYDVSLRTGDSYQTHPLAISATSILDMMFYNSRLYVGASDGLHHMDVDWDMVEVDAPVKRHDARCVGVSAKYGMINSSCGSDGLLTAFDDFNYSGDKTLREFRKIADRSIRTSWINSDFANYQTNRSLSLYHTDRDKIAQSVEGDRQLAKGIRGGGVSVADTIITTLRQHDVPDQSIQYAFNDRRYFFVYTKDGRFFCFHSKIDAQGDLFVDFTKYHKGDGTRILSAQSVRDGVVIETEDRVFLFSGNRWHTIHNGPVISVRTFLRSKRFQNLVAITTEEGVHLVSAVNETQLGR